jgi:hypothetical protein
MIKLRIKSNAFRGEGENVFQIILLLFHIASIMAVSGCGSSREPYKSGTVINFTSPRMGLMPSRLSCKDEPRD